LIAVSRDAQRSASRGAIGDRDAAPRGGRVTRSAARRG